jgi:hypothetical protein
MITWAVTVSFPKAASGNLRVSVCSRFPEGTMAPSRSRTSLTIAALASSVAAGCWGAPRDAYVRGALKFGIEPR